ncbi:N-acetylmannosamine kinase [Deltaproteobacteria bacterium]|nr:N-acetylmannosamine kinase [Deltaproteobacteria bacterium]
MDTSVFGHIRATYDDLPHKLRRVADFILQQQEQAAFLTGKEIAAACDTSPATVARFFRIIGYDKFHDFAAEVQRILKERHLPLRKIRQSFEFSAGDESGRSLEEVCRYERRNIDAFLTQNSRESFERALNAMVSASSLCLVADRSAYAIAHYAGSTLRSFTAKVEFFSSGDSLAYERLETLTENDLLIGVSFHRYARSTWNLMRFSHGRGVPMLAVTDHPSSPLVAISDYYLLAPNEAPFSSYTAAMVLFDALIRGYAARNKGLIRDFEERAAMLLVSDVYINPLEMEQPAATRKKIAPSRKG